MGTLSNGNLNATGTVDMRARQFDPKTGQFLQEDPMGVDGGINTYGFGNGDAVNNRDASGMECSVDESYINFWTGTHLDLHVTLSVRYFGDCAPQAPNQGGGGVQQGTKVVQTVLPCTGDAARYLNLPGIRAARGAVWSNGMSTPGRPNHWPSEFTVWADATSVYSATMTTDRLNASAGNFTAPDPASTLVHNHPPPIGKSGRPTVPDMSAAGTRIGVIQTPDSAYLLVPGHDAIGCAMKPPA
jgi:RHS repeat-associated protein